MIHIPYFDSLPSAVAIDLDGTLLNSASQLSDRSRTALERCIDNGIPVVIATLRAPRTANRALGTDLAEKCSFITLNGAVVTGRKPLSGTSKELMAFDSAGQAVGIIESLKPEARIIAEIEGYEFGSNKQLPPEELWEINAALPEMVLPLGEAISRGCTRIAAYSQGDNLSLIASKLSNGFPDDLSAVCTNSGIFLNIVKKGVSKADALWKLLEQADLSPEKSVAFGDDIPDMDMLSLCGMSFAMSNAAPAVRASAKYTTLSNDEDGVAVVLEEMLASAGF